MQNNLSQNLKKFEVLADVLLKVSYYSIYCILYIFN